MSALTTMHCINEESLTRNIMESLWAPWRIDYILEEKNKGCIFCSNSESDKDDENLVIHRTRDAFSMMNKYPYNTGHVLVSPYKHVSDICDLEEQENNALLQEVIRTIQVLRKVMRPQGFNFGINLGACAGAGIQGHIHYHVVPRWNGDSNIMPVLADVRVMSEHIISTSRKLREGFQNLYPDIANEVNKK
jgi:ATP adenylyltransferase